MAKRRELPPLPCVERDDRDLIEQWGTLRRLLADLDERVKAFGNVSTARRGVIGKAELFLKKGIRRLVLRHLNQQDLLNRDLLRLMEELLDYLEKRNPGRVR